MPEDLTIPERVRESLKQRGVTRALVVDDSLEGRGIEELTLTNWLNVLEILRDEDPETVDKVRDCFNRAGFDELEVEIPETVVNETKGLVDQSSSVRAKGLMSSKRQGELEVERLISYLERLGLEVCIFSTPADAPKDVPLVFLDFQLKETNETAGKTATHFLEQLMEGVGPDAPPPALMLMSRNSPERERWEQVAEQASYLRFCFRYRDKDVLTATEDAFMFHLEELLESWPLGEAYYKHLHELGPRIAKVAKAVVQELMGLTPADFSSFARLRLQDADGTKCASHLRYLFSRLLEMELGSSLEVTESLVAFGKTLVEMPVRQSDYESIALHDLQGRILYDRSEVVKKEPISFGDIYTSQQDEQALYFLVINPECDLEFRKDGNPKAENILFLEAKCMNCRQLGDSLECTPLMRDSPGDPCRWLIWNLRRPVTVPYGKLSAEFRKWGRLSHDHANLLRQRFASDLLEVGTEDIMEGAWTRNVEVFGGDSGSQLKKPVTLAELLIHDSHQLALGPDAYQLFAEPNPLLSIEEVRKLQSPRPVTDFLNLFKDRKLYFAHKDGRLCLVRQVSGSLNSWRPPEAWQSFTAITSEKTFPTA